MPSGIGSWRRRENSGRFVASRLREERIGQSRVGPPSRNLPRAESCGFVNTTPSARICPGRRDISVARCAALWRERGWC